MTTKVKTRAGNRQITGFQQYAYPQWGIGFKPYNTDILVKDWSERIEYDDGPKYVNFHSNWKKCKHIKTNKISGRFAWSRSRRGQGDVVEYSLYAPIISYGIFTPPIIGSVNNAATNMAVALLQEKFDLNCNDRVMGYSYALDLIPLLGPFLKASSVLNRIGQWASKQGRRYSKRPFTSVVEDAARADLINRFVIQTTISDTRQILNVFERCQRAWQTMHTRNTGWTTLTAQASDKAVISNNSFNMKSSVSNAPWPTLKVPYIHERGITSKVEAVLRLNYNTERADPVKWVAQSLGILTPLESVWDKIPFSFVCDYFFRVGDLIENISTKQSSQDGLVGKVADIALCWATSKAFDHYICTEGAYAYGGSSDFWFEQWNTNPGATIGSSTFYRGPIDMSNESGFWDKGGFWNPRLSSTRKRTLIEMAIMATRE